MQEADGVVAPVGGDARREIVDDGPLALEDLGEAAARKQQAAGDSEADVMAARAVEDRLDGGFRRTPTRARLT